VKGVRKKYRGRTTPEKELVLREAKCCCRERKGKRKKKALRNPLDSFNEQKERKRPAKKKKAV